MTLIIHPPATIAPALTKPMRIFLAGSIEMGKATDWQQSFADHFDDNFKRAYAYYVNDEPYIFLNPRRPDWDASWEQKIENPNFYQQVNWELDALDKSTHIIMYLEPGTQSPISLLELGLYAATGKLVVVCPEGFWRKGNVDIVCNRYNVPQFNSVYEAQDYLIKIARKIYTETR